MYIYIIIYMYIYKFIINSSLVPSISSRSVSRPSTFTAGFEVDPHEWRLSHDGISWKSSSHAYLFLAQKKKDDRLRNFLVDAPADHFFVGYIPEDLRLEPEKTPLEEENHLPNHQFNLRRCRCLKRIRSPALRHSFCGWHVFIEESDQRSQG